jgi:hypothetical protein
MDPDLRHIGDNCSLQWPGTLRRMRFDASGYQYEQYEDTRVIQTHGSLRMISALAVTVALTAPALAQADGLIPGIGGLYGGAGAVYTEFDDFDHDSRFGFRLYGGFGIARVPAVFRIAVEGGYTQTGTFRTEALDTGRVSNGDIGLQATLTTLPVVDFHGRAGYEWGDTSGMHYALGVSARIVPLLRIRAEYQLRNDFDAATLGLELRIP